MDKTIEYYNNNADKFTSDTLNCEFNTIQDKFLALLPKKATILDLGCGSGRDSKYFKERGYNVIALDGSIELCKIAEQQIHQNVICMDFKDIDFNNEFDSIWACASLLHLEKKDLLNVLQKCSKALKNNGIFYLSFKYGEFEGYRNNRYFTDLNNESFVEIISQIQDFKIKEIFVTSDVRPNRESEKWLNCFIEKII